MSSVDARGQTTLEYLLLASGVVVLALVVIYMLTQGAQSAGEEVNRVTHGLIREINRQAMNVVQSLPLPSKS